MSVISQPVFFKAGSPGNYILTRQKVLSKLINKETNYGGATKPKMNCENVNK